VGKPMNEAREIQHDAQSDSGSLKTASDRQRGHQNEQPGDDNSRNDRTESNGEKNNDKKGDNEKGSDKDGKDQKPKSRWPIIIAIAVFLLAVIGGAGYWFMTRNQESTDDAYTEGNAVSIAPKVSATWWTIASTTTWLFTLATCC
jgi:membrane fusion protein (multidrug efflux system)